MRYTELLEEAIPDFITINGIARPTTNSQGLFISTTIKGIRNFYTWFGKSVVMDDYDRPLVMYHGTKANKAPKQMIASVDRKPMKNKVTTYIDPFFGTKVKQHSMTGGVGYSKDQAGIFFTSIKNYAANYGNVDAYYLRIKNQ